MRKSAHFFKQYYFFIFFVREKIAISVASQRPAKKLFERHGCGIHMEARPNTEEDLICASGYIYPCVYSEDVSSSRVMSAESIWGRDRTSRRILSDCWLRCPTISPELAELGDYSSGLWTCMLLTFSKCTDFFACESSAARSSQIAKRWCGVASQSRKWHLSGTWTRLLSQYWGQLIICFVVALENDMLASLPGRIAIFEEIWTRKEIHHTGVQVFSVGFLNVNAIGNRFIKVFVTGFEIAAGLLLIITILNHFWTFIFCCYGQRRK